MKGPRYILRDCVNEQRYTAEPFMYPKLDLDHRFTGMDLVKQQHPYHLSTGRIVYADRVLKRDPTMRDLQRLALPF